MLRYENVHFSLFVWREHNKEVKGSIVHMGVNAGGHGQWDTNVKIHPTTPHDQIIARTVRIRIKNP